ncbi:MAG: dephospho-CoA kinase [Flaviaesturariibacter sp.]|nr:dephospho-CoA kinase [Flaviaesturariibacter sp.]
MLKIGITGGIGSGKTTVAKVFALLGVPVYYADEAARRLYATDAALQAALRAEFGDDLFATGTLDRGLLASRVFPFPERLALLNSLVHPLTIADANTWMKAQTAPYVLKEAALLFESDAAAGLDKIIGVSAPKPLRLKRAMDRDGASREAILDRMSRQIDESIKMRLCDFVIVNDEQQAVIPQVLELHRRLLAGVE